MGDWHRTVSGGWWGAVCGNNVSEAHCGDKGAAAARVWEVPTGVTPLKAAISPIKHPVGACAAEQHGTGTTACSSSRQASGFPEHRPAPQRDKTQLYLCSPIREPGQSLSPQPPGSRQQKQSDNSAACGTENTITES